MTETIKCVSCCNNKSEHILLHNVRAELFFLCTQDMDPQWYVGQMSRAEAEVSLRQMNRVSYTTKMHPWLQIILKKYE